MGDKRRFKFLAELNNATKSRQDVSGLEVALKTYGTRQKFEQVLNSRRKNYEALNQIKPADLPFSLHSVIPTYDISAWERKTPVGTLGKNIIGASAVTIGDKNTPPKANIFLGALIKNGPSPNDRDQVLEHEFTHALSPGFNNKGEAESRIENLKFSPRSEIEPYAIPNRNYKYRDSQNPRDVEAQGMDSVMNDSELPAYVTPIVRKYFRNHGKTVDSDADMHQAIDEYELELNQTETNPELRKYERGRLQMLRKIPAVGKLGQLLVQNKTSLGNIG